MNPSDEIKNKLDLVDVIRGYIDLKPAGLNFRANCPFHREKSPSFIVSPDKQIWHCFGCGKGGDLFGFVMEIESLSFIETLRLLAPKAGVELKQVDPKLSSQRNRLLDVMELAAKYYNHVLTTAKQAEPARDYLDKRGLTEDTIREWRIGYSPDSWDDLVNFLSSRGFTPNEIFSAGLSVKKEGTGRFYNRFRGRIMFPIFDVNGNVVAFTARVSPEREAEEKMGKYINSPQTMIYDKGKMIFGLNRAKNEIRVKGMAIVVEGQMDVITAHQYGFKNVIASSGTALTNEQFDLIKRYTNNIALALDADTAGQLATSRGQDVAKALEKSKREMVSEDKYGRERIFSDQSKRHDINISIIEIPNGKDPDECIRKNPDDWQRAVESAKNVMQFYFDGALKNINPDKIEDYRQAADFLLTKIAGLAERGRTEQDYWLRKLAQSLNASEAALYDDLQKAEAEIKSQNAQKPKTFKPSVEPLAPKTREEQLSELLLAIALRYPNFFSYLANNLQLDQVVGAGNQGLYKALIIYYNKNTETWLSGSLADITSNGQNEPNNTQAGTQFSYQIIREWLGLPEAAPALLGDQASIDRIKRKLDELTLLGEKEYFQIETEEARAEIVRITSWLKKHYLKNRLKEVSQQIRQAETEKNPAKLQPLLEEFKFLSDELKEFNHIN